LGTLFRCLVKGNRRRWYISVVPTDQLPGTTHDIDFYTAACINLDDRFPPKYGWIPVSEGQGRPPCVSPVDGDTWRSSDGLQGMPNNDSSNRDASVLHERIDKTTSRGDNVRESVATTIRKIGEINHSPATNQTVTNARQISKKSDYFCERTIGQENVVTNNDDERTSRADKDTALDVIETQRDQPSLSSPSSGNLKASSCSESSITATTSTVPNRKNSIRWNPMEVFGGKEGKNRSGRRSRSRPALLANTGGDLRSGIITMGDNCSNQIER